MKDWALTYISAADRPVFLGVLALVYLKPVLRILSFFAYYFLNVHLRAHYFSKIKSHKEVTKQQE